jgi:RNA polymerase sigma-70 factor (sigma-E family)
VSVPDGAPDADRAGFEEYVVARRGALLRTAYLLTGDHDEAEDLVQVTLVKCVPHWPKIAASPEAYVRKVLARESVTRWRRRRWREVSGPLPEGMSAGTDSDEKVALQAALSRLSPRQRAVVVLRYYDDLTEADTARALGISVGTVKSHARDALARLRELVPDLASDMETGRVPEVAP